MGAIAGIKDTQLVPTMPQVSSHPLTGNSVSGFVCFALGHPKPHTLLLYKSILNVSRCEMLLYLSNPAADGTSASPQS